MSRTYVVVEWNGKFYELCVLPFGLAPACWVFTKINKELVGKWRALSFSVDPYVDVFAFAVRAPTLTDPTTLAVLSRNMQDVREVGWLVAVGKSQLFFTRIVVHIGIGIAPYVSTFCTYHGKQAPYVVRRGGQMGSTQAPAGATGGAAEAARGPAEAVHLRLAHLERLVVRLAQGGLPREAETLAGVVGRLAGGLPAKLAAEHTGFAERACCSALPQGCAAAEHPALARALVSLWLTLPEAPQDLKVALQLVEELHEVLGDEESDGAERSEKITVVNVRTARSVAAAVLGHAEAALEDAEWVLGAMRVGGSGGAGVTAGGGDARGAARSRVEAAVYERLDGVVQILAGMCRITELPGAVAETVLRVLTRVYKALEVAAKALLAPKGVKQALPARQFSGLVEGCARELTPQVYEFIRIMQQAECENEADGGAGKASAAQIKREARSIPNLVFHVEMFEKCLIQLSKATGVNLMRGAKRSTSRDFKINLPTSARDPSHPAAPSVRLGKRPAQDEEAAGAEECVSDEEEHGDRGNEQQQEEEEEEEEDRQDIGDEDHDQSEEDVNGGEMDE
ncbi:hypothetical protein CYMTET_45457 [Cymbomonas tetramitiformis]|uniref:FANCI solenoid 4 domain-containing protein n=1 Tax=Cymbomonas tetramitiformis TaxID=36881 RepID=A0AAE0C000_9CHLO|nr:hypothetical protein CYMTET_45457 [Cymbomonas tetramitiformis]